MDWFAGMAAPSAAAMAAAVAGRAAKERYEAEAELVDPGYTAEDRSALLGRWSWLRQASLPAVVAGAAPLVDDDLALVRPWGFDPALVPVPVLVVHGERDGIVPAAHGRWLAGCCPRSRLRIVSGAGHVTVLDEAESALAWLADSAAAGSDL
jgi:pimeloyl-ACP methyl ester carboxylesterase